MKTADRRLRKVAQQSRTKIDTERSMSDHNTIQKPKHEGTKETERLLTEQLFGEFSCELDVT